MGATVTFVGEPGGEVPVATCDGKTLLESALASGVPLFNDCGGQARCTTCRVRVVEGELPMRTADEAEIARAGAEGCDSGEQALQVVNAFEMLANLLDQSRVRDEFGDGGLA